MRASARRAPRGGRPPRGTPHVQNCDADFRTEHCPPRRQFRPREKFHPRSSLSSLVRAMVSQATSRGFERARIFGQNCAARCGSECRAENCTRSLPRLSARNNGLTSHNSRVRAPRAACARTRHSPAFQPHRATQTCWPRYGCFGHRSRCGARQGLRASFRVVPAAPRGAQPGAEGPRGLARAERRASRIAIQISEPKIAPHGSS